MQIYLGDIFSDRYYNNCRHYYIYIKFAVFLRSTYEIQVYFSVAGNTVCDYLLNKLSHFFAVRNAFFKIYIHIHTQIYIRTWTSIYTYLDKIAFILKIYVKNVTLGSYYFSSSF